MIELLNNLKVSGVFRLNPSGEFVRYNEKFQPQEVVVEVARKLLEILLVLEFFWDLAFIKIVCILYVVHYFCMYIGLYCIL
jgi:hypothetical protein